MHTWLESFHFPESKATEKIATMVSALPQELLDAGLVVKNGFIDAAPAISKHGRSFSAPATLMHERASLQEKEPAPCEPEPRKEWFLTKTHYVHWAMWRNLPLKITLVLPPVHRWPRCGAAVVEESCDIPRNSLLRTTNATVSLSLVHLARLLRPWHALMPRGILIIGRQLSNFWHISPRGVLELMPFATAFNVYIAYAPPTFVLARCPQATKHAHLVPCRLENPSTSLDICAGRIEVKAFHTETWLSAIVYSLQYGNESGRHAMFEVKPTAR